MNSTSDNWKDSTKKTTRGMQLWIVAWLATLALASFGPIVFWNYATLPTVFAVLANLVAGFFMIKANKHYIQSLDEMQRKIFLDASALSLGVGVVCGLSYEMLEDIKLITFQPEIPHVILLMSITLAIGLTIGNRSYR